MEKIQMQERETRYNLTRHERFFDQISLWFLMSPEPDVLSYEDFVRISKINGLYPEGDDE